MSPARRTSRRPLVRRDADGGQQTAPGWSSLTERLIRQAQEDGRFDDLPFKGRPIHVDEDIHAGDLALAHHLLRDAGLAPPWVEADKEVRRLEAAIDALVERAGRGGRGAGPRLQGELERLVAEHDDAVGRLESLAPTPRQQRRRLDAARVGARLDAALADGSAA